MQQKAYKVGNGACQAQQFDSLNALINPPVHVIPYTWKEGFPERITFGGHKHRCLVIKNVNEDLREIPTMNTTCSFCQMCIAGVFFMEF